jgi:predicted metalloprotease
MKLDGFRRSGNVEDRRGGGGGGGGRVAISGGTIVVVLLVSVVTGINPLTLLSGLQQGGTTTSAPATPGAETESSVFVSKVLATTEDAWNELAPSLGVRYREPKLVLFRDAVSSACGQQSSAVGPFYCPGDEAAYLDLTFFDELSERFGAPGDFAAAYVVAHEIGHHVQNLTGASRKVGSDREGANSGAVRLELQADCYAGVWAHWAQKKGLLEAGDAQEALRAANQIGDDTLQRRGRGHVTPDSFTHGTSAQRQRWFGVGLEGGDARRCDTFGTGAL